MEYRQLILKKLLKRDYNSLDAVSLNQNKLILKAYEEVENRLETCRY
ncbi:hypothetical protein ACVNPX_12135 [Staphylococcus aureus]